MPFSDDVRNELAAVAPRKECDRLAELSGLAHAAGSVHLRGRGEVAVHLDLGSSAVARRAFALLRSFGVDSEIRTYTQRAFERPTRYQLHVSGDARALQVLHEAGVLTARLAPLERPPKRVVARSCCRGAYLRGALLGGGSLSGPRAPHLELRAASLGGAELLSAVAAEEGLELRVVDRGRHAVAYAKGAETIAGVLAAAGAGGVGARPAPESAPARRQGPGRGSNGGGRPSSELPRRPASSHGSPARLRRAMTTSVRFRVPTTGVCERHRAEPDAAANGPH